MSSWEADSAAMETARPTAQISAQLAAPLPQSSAPNHVGLRALMQAVLDDAIRCYFGRPGRTRAEAELWIESGRGDSPFGFVVVCETLGLDADAVRVVLRRERAASSGANNRRPPRYRPNTRSGPTIVGPTTSCQDTTSDCQDTTSDS